MSTLIYDVLILGGGPGGYTAALYCTRAGRKTALIERMSPGGQMCLTTQIDNYPGFPSGIDGFSLGEAMQKGAERFGAQTIYSEILSVDLQSEPKTVTTDGGTYAAHTVILATGATHRHLHVPGEQELLGRGVGYCAACDGMLFKGKRVAVVGGGDTAAGDALYLSELCESVTLIHRRDALRATKIYRDALAKKENVNLLFNASITAVQGENKVSSIRVATPGGEKTLEVDGVFISIGREPTTALFKGQLALDSAGYVIADETTRTTIDGVFAVGDLRTKPMRQVVTAAADGATASHFVEEYFASRSN